MFLFVVIKMEVDRLIQNWFVWRETSLHLQNDKQVIASSSVRFPMGYEYLLHYLLSASQFMTQTSYRRLRRQGVRILGEHKENNVFFVLCKHQQETRLIRMTHDQLKNEMQRKMEELIRNVGEIKEQNSQEPQ